MHCSALLILWHCAGSSCLGTPVQVGIVAMNLIGEALPPETQATLPAFVSNHYQPDRPPANAGGRQLPVRRAFVP